MKKWPLLSLLIIVGAVAFYFHTCVEPFPASATTTSPTHVFQVNLKEKAQIYYLPFGGFWSGHGDHEMRFTVTKNGNLMVENEGLYGGDSLDDRFMGRYPNHKWIGDNVLWFGWNEVSPTGKADEVNVSNQTSRVIRYLNVDAGDRFLVLDLPPQNSVRLFARPQTDQTADISWIACFGRFDEGTAFNGGMNFRIRGKYVAPAHYCVVIRNEGVVIQSKDFEGLETDVSTTVKSSEAKNADCQ